MPGMRFHQRRFLPIQPLDRLARIVVQALLALHIPSQLGYPRLQVFNRLPRTLLLFVQRVSLDQQTLQYRACNRFFLTQWRHFTFGFSPLFGLRRCLSLRGRGPLGRCGQRLESRLSFNIRLAPATIQQQTFSATQFIGNLAVTRRLTCLACQ